MKKLKSNLITTVSLSTAMAVLLSSVSPVYAASLAIQGWNNQGSNANTQNGAVEGSHGSIILAGVPGSGTADNYNACGADLVIGRGGGSHGAGGITAEEQYIRFVENQVFGGKNPYGVVDTKTNQSDSGYMGSLTGGVVNAKPEAYGIFSFATGCGSSATGNYSTAFGSGATASAGGAMAFGVSALASGRVSFAMGVGSEASGESAVALGGLSLSSGKESVAIGTRATANADYGVAIGSRAQAQAQGSIAIGSADSDEKQAIAGAANAIAIGSHAQADTDGSVSIGINAQVVAEGGVAVGAGAVSRAESSIAGYNPGINTTLESENTAWVSTKGAFSIGDVENGVTRQITGVAAGTSETDAVNVAQLKALKGYAESLELNISVNEENISPNGKLDFSAASDNLKVVKDSDSKIAFDLAKNITLDSVKVGDSVLDAAGLVIAGGPKITNDGIDAGNKVIANLKGGKVSVASAEAVTGGQLYALSDTFAKYLGGGARYEDENWTAPKFDIVQFNSDALSDEKKSYDNVSGAFDGVNAAFTNLNSKIDNVKNNLLIKQDGDSDIIAIGNEVAGTVISVTNRSGVSRKLTGVASGQISVDSSDAINGSQLYSVNNTLASYFGGGANFGNGVWTAPKFDIVQLDSKGVIGDKQSYNNVSGAFDGVNAAFTNLNSKIDNVKNNLLIKQDGDSNIIAIGNEVAGTVISVTNRSGVSRKLTGVASGQISVDSSDAINGSQLYSVNNTLASYFGGGANFGNGVWTAPKFDIVQLDSKGVIGDKQSYNNVSGAFDGVNTAFTNLNSKIDNVRDTLKDNLLIKQDKSSNIITIGNEVLGTVINVTNSSGMARKLTGVASGQVSANSFDAINGSQLYSVNNTLASYFGGGVNFENGVWTAPKFDIVQLDSKGVIGDKQSYNNVSGAFDGVNTAFTNLNSKIDNVRDTLKDNLLIKQDKSNNIITIGSEVVGLVVDVANSGGVSRKITGVDSGQISVDSSDAINGSQLYSVNNTLASYFGGDARYENGRWTGPRFDIIEFNSDGLSNGKKSYYTVSSAFDAVGSNFANLNKNIRDVQDGLLVKQARDMLPITIGQAVGGILIDFTNKDGVYRKLTGVADGLIFEGSTEAVNGGQLYSVGDALVSYLGGNAKYANGMWTDPIYRIQGTAYNNVGSAFEGVNNSITSINNSILDIKNDISGNINPNTLVWDSYENAFVANHVIDGVKTNAKLKFLLDGNISLGSTEAVTGGQLYSVNKTFSTYFGGGANFENGVWVAPKFEVVQFNSSGLISEKRSYNNVASAFSGVNEAFVSLDDKINDVKNQTLVQQNGKIAPINIGAGTGGNRIIVANSDGASRIISGVMAGSIAEGSTEVITGNQLYSMSNMLATYFGGGARYENGGWTLPNFKVTKLNDNGVAEEASYTNVADALAGMSNSFKNIKNDFTTEITQEVIDQITGNVLSDLTQTVITEVNRTSLIKQGSSTKPITIGGNTGGTEIIIANSDGASRIVSGVKAGSISEGSTEAITGGQLYSVSNMLATYFGGGARYEGGEWKAPDFTVVTLNDDGVAEEASYTNVADALAGMSNSFKNIKNDVANGVSQDVIDDITQIVTTAVKSTSLVKQNESTNAITIGGEIGGAEITVSNSEGLARIISGVKAGSISEGSTEAITGGQLYSVSNMLATYFGGGARYEDGEWKAPDFTVVTLNDDGVAEEASYTNVADALAGMSNSFKNIKNDVANGVSQDVIDDITQTVTNAVKSTSLVKQDKSTNAITIGGEIGGTAITVANSEGVSRSISGVKAGTLAAGSTEAVNGAQLYLASNALASYFGGGAKYEGGEWKLPDFTITQVNDEGAFVEGSYKSVADALAGISSSFINIKQGVIDGVLDDVTEEIVNGINNDVIAGITQTVTDAVNGNRLVKQDESTNVIIIGGNVAGNEITVANNDGASRIVSGVKAGTLAAGSTDAVNGAQLYLASNALATYFGGGARYEDGKWTFPDFTVVTLNDDGVAEEASYTNVADALAGMSNSFKNIKNDVANGISQDVIDDITQTVTTAVKNTSLVKQNSSTNTISIGGEIGGTAITVANSEGVSRSISGVKAGMLTAGSTEAVNGAQLYLASNALASYFGGGAKYEGGEWKLPDFTITQVNDEGAFVEGSYKSVADALAGISSSFINIKQGVIDGVLDDVTEEIVNGINNDVIAGITQT
ncbi:hypothetical protein, partial [Bartonella sp. CB74]|uniref:hypothetical protein n=1 Tax=Bartonella sp. CB74 TaxID=3113620 RepID=UPI002F967E6D